MVSFIYLIIYLLSFHAGLVGQLHYSVLIQFNIFISDYPYHVQMSKRVLQKYKSIAHV